VNKDKTKASKGKKRGAWKLNAKQRSGGGKLAKTWGGGRKKFEEN